MMKHNFIVEEENSSTEAKTEKATKNKTSETSVSSSEEKNTDTNWCTGRNRKRDKKDKKSAELFAWKLWTAAFSWGYGTGGGYVAQVFLLFFQRNDNKNANRIPYPIPNRKSIRKTS